MPFSELRPGGVLGLREGAPRATLEWAACPTLGEYCVLLETCFRPASTSAFSVFEALYEDRLESWWSYARPGRINTRYW
jgi:hypothetical protein